MRPCWILVSPLLAATLSGQTLEQRLEAAVAEAAPDYWGTILVAQAGEPVFVRGYGTADGKAGKPGRKPKPMDTKAVFDLGGASELLTVLLVLQLQEARKLKFSDPVGKHLDDWPADKQAITIEHLVAHTSGLPQQGKWPSGAANAKRTVLPVFARKKLRTLPGKETHYTQLNANVLALVIEEAAGKRFDQLLETKVLKPFGMKGAGNCNERFAGKLVTVRRKDGGEHEPANAVNYNWRMRGARGILASVHDVHSLIERLLHGRIVDAEQRARAWRPLKGGSYRIDELEAFGRKLRRISGHGGGFQTRWSIDEESRSWVVLCSQSGYEIGPLERALGAALFEPVVESSPMTEPVPQPAIEPQPEPQRPPPSPAQVEQLERFVGTFALPRGGAFRIERHAAGLRMFGAGVQASVRITEGAWPGARGELATRTADRGLMLIERLIGGDASAVDEAFTDSATASTATRLLAGIIADRGAHRRTEFVGTEIGEGGAPLSWFRIVCAGGSAMVRLTWRDARRIARCELSGDESPFAIDLMLAGPDWAGGRTASGKIVKLTVEGRPGARTLVFEDATPGAVGLIDCREVR